MYDRIQKRNYASGTEKNYEPDDTPKDMFLTIRALFLITRGSNHLHHTPYEQRKCNKSKQRNERRDNLLSHFPEEIVKHIHTPIIAKAPDIRGLL